MMKTHSHSFRGPLLASAFTTIALANSVAATEFLTINVTTDELVRVNSETGVVTPIGPLGFDLVHHANLVWLDGTLYLLDSGIGTTHPELYTLDTATGTAHSVAQLQLPGETIEFAEAMLARDDELIVVLDVDPGNGPRSGQIGRLDPNSGLIEPLGQILPDVLSDGGDIDGATWDAINERLVVFDADDAISGTMSGTTDLLTGETIETSIILERDAAGYILSPYYDSGSIWSVSRNIDGTAGAVVRLDPILDGWAVGLMQPILDPAFESAGIAPLQIATSCTADTNHSGNVDFDDLLQVLSSWGGFAPDLDGDGVVGFSDLVILLASWGPCS